jgi:hypothetical protein
MRDSPRRLNDDSSGEMKPGFLGVGALVSRCATRTPRSQRFTRQNPSKEVKSMNQPDFLKQYCEWIQKEKNTQS